MTLGSLSYKEFGTFLYELHKNLMEYHKNLIVGSCKNLLAFLVRHFEAIGSFFLYESHKRAAIILQLKISCKLACKEHKDKCKMLC